MRATLLFLLLASSLSPRHGSEQQKPSDNKQNVASNSQDLPSVSSVEDKQGTAQESTKPSSEPKDAPEKSFWGDLPTWGLFLVGLVGAWIAVRTLNDIKKQTNALIGGNRSWITVEVEKVPGVGGLMDGSGMQMGVGPLRTESTGFRARIICRNDGKAPAWITKKQAGLDIVDTVPENPDWTRTNIIQETPEQLLVGQVGKPMDETLISKRGRAAGKITILYGLITYRDPFGDGKTASFGYCVRDDGSLQRLPNSKYNQNT